MSHEPTPPPEKGHHATKVAWIGLIGAVLAALLTAAATILSSQIQAGAAKPADSATPVPSGSTSHQVSRPNNEILNSPSPKPSRSETAFNEPISIDPNYIMVKDLVPIKEDSWDTSWDIVEAAIGGDTYPDSLWASSCSMVQTSQQVYVIGKDYQRFESMVGVDDFSTRDSPIYFSVVGDGKTIYERRVYPGTPVSIAVPVSGVIRLTLKIEIDDYESDCDETLAIWAKARLVRQPPIAG